MIKTVIIGANHGGIAAANTLLASYPNHKIIMIDGNTNLSYLGCGTALWIGRQIESYEQLFYTNAEEFKAKGVSIYMETTVTEIDFENKVISCLKKGGEQFTETYDKLILATGSRAIEPDVPGKNLANVKFLKLFQEGQAVDELMSRDEIKNIAVIGAGYIGVELAEAAKRRGKNVLLFDAARSTLSRYYDDWFTDDMDKILANEGIELHFNECAIKYTGTTKVEGLVTSNGEYPVDLVINAIGFRPNSDLGKGYLTLFDNGAYLVDNHQRTSDPDVYAIGDCATIFSNAIQQTTYIALASNAVRTGVVAAHNLAGTTVDSVGVQGSNGISIFGYNMVSTGLSVTAAALFGIKPEYTDFEDFQRPVFMKTNDRVKIRIVYEASSRRLIGAQIASYGDISLAIHLFSLAIQEQMTIDKFKLLDIFFLPHFNQPYNYITMAALSAK